MVHFCFNESSYQGVKKTMSGIQSQVSDQTNQSIAILGGATAQSYGAVSLNALPIVPDSQNADVGSPFANVTDTSIRSDSATISQTPEKFFVDTSASFANVRTAASNLPEDLSESPDSFIESNIENPDLISRFESSALEDEGLPNVQQTVVPGSTLNAEDPLDVIEPGGSVFSLLDFIEQAIAQAEASQQEFGDTFDGSRQGEFRELLVDTGMALGSEIRDFLQENVAGVGRELLSDSIDATGVELLGSTAEPLLAIDYYAKSAEVLNGLMEAVGQPIGSISLPQLGPLLADPREELSAYLG